MSDDTPTDEQVREWFPKLFADIDDELEELDACLVCKGFPEPACPTHGDES